MEGPQWCDRQDSPSHGPYDDGNPQQLASAVRRTWADNPTSERIVEDMSRYPLVIDKIVEHKGGVVPDFKMQHQGCSKRKRKVTEAAKSRDERSDPFTEVSGSTQSVSQSAHDFSLRYLRPSDTVVCDMSSRARVPSGECERARSRVLPSLENLPERAEKLPNIRPFFGCAFAFGSPFAASVASSGTASRDPKLANVKSLIARWSARCASVK